MKANFLKAALLASGAALALGTVVPASAASPVASGYVDAWAALGHASYSETEGYYEDGTLEDTNHYGEGRNFNVLGGDGRANLLWDSGFGIQLDAQESDVKYSHEGDGSDETTTDLAAHFYQRSDDMLWGGFASIGSQGDRWATIGAEFQKYCDQWTFYAQASWSGGISGYASSENANSWNFNVEARYFVTPHFKLYGGVGFDVATYSYSDSDSEGYHASGHQHTWNWTLGAEYLLSDLPVSIFGEYEGTYAPYHDKEFYEDGGYGSIYRGHDESNLFLIGVRIFMNQQDLLTNDRTGASLKDFNPYTGVLSSVDY